MLKVILFFYSRGLISSHCIADACATNITLISLSGDVQPPFTSIVAFVAKMSEQIAPLFTQVLMICDEEGLIGRNMFAIDGCNFYLNERSPMPARSGAALLKSLRANKRN